MRRIFKTWILCFALRSIKSKQVNMSITRLNGFVIAKEANSLFIVSNKRREFINLIDIFNDGRYWLELRLDAIYSTYIIASILVMIRIYCQFLLFTTKEKDRKSKNMIDVLALFEFRLIFLFNVLTVLLAQSLGTFHITGTSFICKVYHCPCTKKNIYWASITVKTK